MKEIRAKVTIDDQEAREKINKLTNGNQKITLSIDTKSVNEQLNRLLENIEKINNAGKNNKINTTDSVKAIKKEADAMIKLLESATKASKGKKDFTEANKKLKASADSSVNSIINEQNAMQSMSNRCANNINNMSNAFRVGTNYVQSFGNSFREALSTFTLANIMTRSIYGTVDALKDAIGTVKRLNDYATSLRMATDEGNNYVSNLIDSYNKMGQELGALTSEISESADEWLRQGHTISETNELIKDSMILSKVSKLESAESTKYLTSAMQGYKVSVEDVINIVDKLSAVDMKSATNAGGLAEAMSRTSESAYIAGISMDRLIGMIATTGEVTQKSMSSIGESFKTIFSRMRDIKDGNLSAVGDGEIENLSNVETVLNSMGIKIRNSNKEFRNFQIVLDEVAEGWNNYSSVQQAAIAKAFSGVRQQENFLVMMENWDKVKKYTDVAMNSAGTATEKFGAYIESLNAKTKSLKTSLEALATDTISDETYGGVLDFTKSIVDATKETQILKGALAGITTAGAIYAFSRLITLGTEVANNFVNMASAMNIVRNSAIVDETAFNTLLNATSGLSQSQLRLILSSSNLTTAQRIQILTQQGLSEAEATARLETLGLMTAEEGLTGVTLTLSNVMTGLFETLLANPLVLITIGVTAGVTAWNNYKQSVEKARQAALDQADASKEEADSLEDLYIKYSQLQILHERTESQEQEYQELLKQVIEALGSKSEALKELTKDTEEYTTALENASKAELKDAWANAKSGTKAAKSNVQDTLGILGNSSSIYKPNRFNRNNDAYKIAESNLGKYSDIFSTEWGINSKDINDVLEYFYAIKKTKDEIEHLDDASQLDTTTYENISKKYTELSDSVNEYIKKKYEELKLEYEWQNGIPTTVEDFEKMKKIIVASTNAGEGFKNEITDLLNQDFSDIISNINNIEKKSSSAIEKTIITVKDIKKAFDAMSTDDTVSEFKDTLIELADKGKLTEKAFKKLDGVEKYFKALGISAEDAINYINSLVSSTNQLDSMSKSIRSLSENLYNKQQNPSEAIDISVLNDMDAGLKACTKEWNKYIITLGTASSSTEEVQQATDRLATAYVNSNNFLANLTDKTQDYYISQLDAMGVENAREVVLSALAMKESESIAIKIDLTNKTWDEIRATNEYIKASDLTRQALAKLYIQKQLLNNQELKTANDIQNLINLAKEADITGKYIKRLMEIKSLYQSQKNYLSNHQGAPVNFIELDKYKKEIQDIANAPITSDVDVKIDTSGSKSAMSDAKKSAKETKKAAKETKTAIDWISQSLKVLQQNIDLTKAKFENLFTVKAKKNNVKEQIKETKTLLDQTKRSVKAYEKEFSKVMNKLRKPIKTTVKTVKKSGKDLVSVAEKELGYTEGRNNNTKYGKFTGHNFAAWCQSFVSWVANKAGLSTSQTPKTASTDTGMAFFKNKGEFGVKGKYTPKRNDTVYFKSGGRSHVGIVKAVKNGKVYTIEGNSSDKVKARSYSLNDATITGYGKTSKYFKAKNKKNKKNKKKTVEKPLTKKEISEIEQLITNAIKTDKALKKSMLIKKYGQERAKQIQDAIGEFDNLEQAKVKVQELKKEIRELNKELYQIDIDNYNKVIDKQSAKLDIINTPTLKNKILKNQLATTKKLYNTQINQAKVEKDNLEVVKLRYEKEKAIYEIRQSILQATLDNNDTKRSINDAKRSNASTAKVQGKLYDADVKTYNSDIKAYKQSVKDQNNDVSNKGKSVTKAKNFNKLKKTDRNKIKSLIKNGKAIPNSIIKKAEKISSTLATKMENYNTSVEIAKTVSQNAEIGIQEALNSKRETIASKYDAYADEAQSIADAYSAQSYGQYSAKDKEKLNNNIQKQMDKAYKYQIKAAKERGDFVLAVQLQAEWDKDKLDRTLENMQNYVDEIQSEMDLNDTYAESTDNAWEKGIYLERNRKLIEEQAKLEADMLKKQGKTVEAQKVLVDAKKKQLDIEKEIHSLRANAYDTLSGTHNTKADTSTNIKDRLSNNLASLLYNKKSYEEQIKAETDSLKIEQLQAEQIKTLNDNWMTVISSMEQYFQREMAGIEKTQSHLESMISLTEAHGSFVSADMYTSLAEEKNKERIAYNTQVLQLSKALAESGLQEGSDAWYEAKDNIDNARKAAEEATIACEEYKQKAIEANQALAESGRKAVSALKDEADFYKNIVAHKDLVDEKTGELTNEGKVSVTLSASNMSTDIELVRKLNEALMENEYLYANGDIGYDKYIETRERLNSEIRSTIENYYDEADAIKTLIENAYNAQSGALDDLIDKYKKALQAEKSLHDYQKNIEKQTKNLVTLQKRLAALQGDNSEEAKAKIQKLQVEIADAQDELNETEYDKYIEDQETMLDKLKEEYEKFIEDQMNDIDVLIEKVIEKLPQSAELVNKKLNEIAGQWSIKLSDAINNITENGSYSTITGSISSNATEVIRAVSNMAEKLEQESSEFKETLDILTDVYNTNNTLSTQLPSINTLLEQIKDLIANKESTIIVNANESANENTIPEIPSSQTVITPTPSETKPSTSTQTTIPEKPTIIPITAEMYPKPEKPISTNPLNPNGSIVSNVNKPVTEREAMLAETRAYIKLNAYDAPRKKSEYSAPNQYIYDKTGGKILGKEQLAELAKKLGVTPGDSTDDTWKNKMLKKLKAIGYSKGGVVGALQRIPGENGDDGWITVKHGEAILTPEQTKMFKNLVSGLPMLDGVLNGMNNTPKQLPIKNIDNAVHIGNITVEGSNITDAETFAKELPRAMIKAVQTDRQCFMTFQDIGIGQLPRSNKSYMKYR